MRKVLGGHEQVVAGDLHQVPSALADVVLPNVLTTCGLAGLLMLTTLISWVLAT